MTMKFRQGGAFLMARALMIVGILMAMLVIPVYLKKEREEREAAVHKAELAHSQGSGAVPGVAVTAVTASGARSDGASAARPIGYGLTFVVISDDKAPPDVAPELPRRARCARPAPPGIVQSLPRRHLLPHRASRAVRPTRGGAFAGWMGRQRLSGLDRWLARRDHAGDGGGSGVCGDGVGALRKGTRAGLADGRVS